MNRLRSVRRYCQQSLYPTPQHKPLEFSDVGNFVSSAIVSECALHLHRAAPDLHMPLPRRGGNSAAAGGETPDTQTIKSQSRSYSCRSRSLCLPALVNAGRAQTIQSPYVVSLP